MPDLKLQNHDGSYTEFEGVETVTIPDTSDGEVTFGLGEDSYVSIAQGHTSTPLYDNEADPPVVGHAGDLADLTISVNIPIGSEIISVDSYFIVDGLLYAGTPTTVPIYGNGNFQHFTTYTSVTCDEYLTISKTVQASDFLISDNVLNQTIKGHMNLTGLMVVHYK